jgi:dolichol-phosphate mannosyltransferase
MGQRETADVSIVIPVKDEVESISTLSDEIRAAFDTVHYSWECLWIDDGSRDGSSRLLQDLCDKHSNYHCIQFDRSYGQSAAIAIGFKYSVGEIIATLDSDLQNDPRDLPIMIDQLKKEEKGMIIGVRQQRKDNIIKIISSRIANSFRNWILHDQLRDISSSVRVFHRDCVENISVFRSMHRFLPILLIMKGYKVSEVAVNHRARRYGRTKYGIHNRLWVGLADTLAVLWIKKRIVEPKIRVTSYLKPDEEKK